MLKLIVRKSFKEDLKKIIRQGKDQNKLWKVVESLQKDEPLPAKFKDHALSSSRRYKNCRECHLEPDWLLVYFKDDTNLVLVLIDTGSHSHLFS